MSNPLNSQIGGDHYKDMAIQPAQFIAANKIGFFEGCAIKYICRHEKKGGIEDIDKAIHFLEMLKYWVYGVAYEDDSSTTVREITDNPEGEWL